jgi:predicted dehydrogenase
MPTHCDLSRRGFIFGMAALLPVTKALAAAPGLDLTAAIIGHTGSGNYGHGLDLIFNGLPHVRTLAVADSDSAGLQAARLRIGVEKGYESYQEMLSLEKPDLVSVAPRATEEHFAMVNASLLAGAHVFCEKPFTTTLQQSDQLLRLANKLGKKIVVAHQMRLAPNVVKLREAVANGLLGELVEMHAFGKQDARAGGEDMIVLGTHLFDLMRLFAGDVLRCSATIWTQRKLAKLEDRKNATEKIGPILGDEIEAQFEFEKGVLGTFVSRARLREAIGRWRLELIGTKGSARILMDIDPDVLLLKNGGEGESWVPFAPLAQDQKGFSAANRRVAMDWLSAIQDNREPICSGASAAKAVEMAMAVYEAHLNGRRVELPLSRREHPLMS